MKAIIILFITLISIQQLSAQTLVISSGASMYVPAGADICAGTYGNITGNIFGEGKQCGLSPLPVELQSFTATKEESGVILYWQTATEINNYGFEIEKNVNVNWEKIGFAEGHGNSSSPKEYSFIDKNLIGGSKFRYRLKQIDNDGKFEYSDVVEIEAVPTEFVLYQNYPNPFNPVTTIKYQLPKESKVVIKIYNILGAEVIELLNEKKEAGIYETEFNAEQLTSGTYIYRIITDNLVQSKKMILLK